MSKKQQYRVLNALDYPTDPKVIKRLLAGEQIPWEERRMKHVEPGEVVDDVPECSVPWLLEQRQIEPADGEGV